MNDDIRRRLLWLSVGALYLLLVSCNVVRALNGRTGVGFAAGAAAAPPGTLPLLTSAQPGLSPVPLVEQQRPAAAIATPPAPAASGAPLAGRVSAPAATTPELVSSPQPEALNPVPSPSPVGIAPTTPLSGPAPNPFSTIQGTTVRATGTALSKVTVRLRDARFGRIVDKQTTDASGTFAFRSVDPGVYLVEIVGDNGNVLAASQVLNVSAGDTASAVVRLPFRAVPLGGVLGDSVPSAAVVAAEAAAAGVLTTTITDPVTPTQ